MGGMSIWHWIIIAGVFLLLFGGKGKISDIMGDVAKGVKSFKKGMADDEPEQPVRPPVSTPAAPVEPRALDNRTTTTVEGVNETRRVG